MTVCSPFSDELINEGGKYTNVEYSEDGKSITIYLDGSAPVPANRSISTKLAQIGHDFFEVTFLHNGNGTEAGYTIARASWELGEPAGVSGVYRTAAGINYYGTNPVGIPAVNQGTAVLFVGRKSDKSLLAVGTLSIIDETNISTSVPATQLITTNTKKVTFAVNALKAGVDYTYASTSNSLEITSLVPSVPNISDVVTNWDGKPASDRTKLGAINIGGLPFPFFHIPISTVANATYTIGVNSPTSTVYPSGTTLNFGFYAPAIRYAGLSTADLAKNWNIKPKYTLLPSPAPVQDFSLYKYSDGTSILFDTGPGKSPGSLSTGAPFPGRVDYVITTYDTNSYICALTFRIPVYAVYKRSTPVPGEAEPVSWLIKPGFGAYYEELDNGYFTSGGAVLIGIGLIESGNQPKQLLRVGEPRQFNNVPGDGGLQFDIKGLQFYFKNGDGQKEPLTPDTDSKYPSYWGWPGLEFFYDSNDNGVADEPMPDPASGWVLPLGRIKIMVVYTDSQGATYTDTFYVNVSDISEPIIIPYENRFFCSKPNDFLDVANNVTHGSYLLVFAENVNIPNMAFSKVDGDVNIFIVATVANIILGREGGTRITVAPSGAFDFNIYLGEWPFNEPAFAGGDVITNEPFILNAGGTFGNAFGPATMSTYMFQWEVLGNPHGTLTVKVLPGAEVRNSQLLKQP